MVGAKDGFLSGHAPEHCCRWFSSIDRRFHETFHYRKAHRLQCKLPTVDVDCDEHLFQDFLL